MLALSHKTTTLFTFLTLLLVATAVEAHTPLERRGGHASLKRIIKKRSPQGLFGDGVPPPIAPIGAAPRPSSESESASAEPSASGSASGSASASASASVSASGSASASGSISASGSDSVSASRSASVSASASASASVESSASTPEATPPPTEAPTGPTFTERSTSTRQASTKVVTMSVDAAEETAPAPAMAGAAAQTKSDIATILIAIVASIGGVFIIWTIFRKWKFGSSRKFDQKMNPIGWDKEDPPNDRRMSDQSFHSNSAHSHRVAAGLTQGIPDHDFTAVPSRSSPVGGYADMSRGPSRY